MSFRVTRTADANWQGTVPDGGGRIALGSGAFEGPFTLKARVEEVERATNPEELIGAAEAGCFTMSLANWLADAGHPPADLRTTAKVRLEQGEGGSFRSPRSRCRRLETSRVDAGTFVRFAEEAKATCPVSRALAGTRSSSRRDLQVLDRATRILEGWQP